MTAHKVFYEIFEGPIPAGKYLQHYIRTSEFCAGRACCNPDHPQLSDSPVMKPPTGIPIKVCPHGHLRTAENTNSEAVKGKPTTRCRTCSRESWRKSSARRAARGLHS